MIPREKGQIEQRELIDYTPQRLSFKIIPYYLPFHTQKPQADDQEEAIPL
jgi:hypothetical protein